MSSEPGHMVIVCVGVGCVGGGVCMCVCGCCVCVCVCTYVGVEVDTKSREELPSLSPYCCFQVIDFHLLFHLPVEEVQLSLSRGDVT